MVSRVPGYGHLEYLVFELLVDLSTLFNEIGAPAWMATYGDMVTLLLTLFIALMGTQVPEGS